MLFKLFSKIFANQIQTYTEEKVRDALIQERKNRMENEESFRQVEAEYYVGKPIIALSNEWNEPIVGELLRVEGLKRGVIYVYKNYITNEEAYTLVSPMAFSEQKLKVIGKLNPDEICCLLYEGKSSYGEFRKHPTYGKQEVKNMFSNYENWKNNLKINGFYEKFGNMLNEEELDSFEHLNNLEKKHGAFLY